MKPDRAVLTARSFLDGTICECGHTESEHLMFADTSKCAEKPCRCKVFRPVRFTVERA